MKIEKTKNTLFIKEHITVRELSEFLDCTYQNASYTAKKYLKFTMVGRELIILPQTADINKRPAALNPNFDFDLDGLNLKIYQEIRLIQAMKVLNLSFHTLNFLLSRNEVKTQKRGRNVFIPPCELKITSRIKKRISA